MNIETRRLILTPVSEEHIEEIFKYFNKQVTTYMIPCEAKDIDETCEVVQKFIKQRKNNTDYVYAITLKANNEFIGLVGVHNLREEIPELGIWTKIGSHGNHYGREAVGGVIEHAKSLGIKKVCYPVDRRNVPSKSIPIFYGGKLIIDSKEIKTADGRILEEEIYEINI